MRTGACDGLTIMPDDDAIEELKQSWSWLLSEPYRPILFTALGDMFFQAPSGHVHWLNTGTGEVTKVAASLDEFERQLSSEQALDWFLPPLIEKLVQAGKVLKAGECYTFVTLPIFREGTYTVENLNPVNAKFHFGLSGSIHEQIRELPDGAKVEIKIVD